MEQRTPLGNEVIPAPTKERRTSEHAAKNFVNNTGSPMQEETQDVRHSLSLQELPRYVSATPLLMGPASRPYPIG